MMKYIRLIDSTLREGKQSSLNKILINKAERYIKLVHRMGIEYLEINHPYTSTKFLVEYRKMASLKTGITIFAHSAAKIEDFELLKKEGIKNISTFLIGNHEATLTKHAINILEWGKKNGIKLRITIENTFAIPKGVVGRIYKRICKHEAISHLCLADSSGLATPEIVEIFFRHIDSLIAKRIPIELHFHNDQGLAAANFYTVYRLAEKLHRDILVAVSISGIGERNGILSYGDVFSILAINNKNELQKRYQINLYKKLLDLIFSEKCSFNRDPLNPSSFKHAAASHIKRVIDEGKFEPIKPSYLGFSSDFVIGELFGTDALIEIANAYFNISIPYQKAKQLSAYIRNSFSKSKKSLTLQDLNSLIVKRAYNK